jgi:RNA polymerase sigma factor (sigma-70 family)
MSSTSDENRTREKYREQIVTLFLKYRVLVLQAALRVLGNQREAEDVVQNIFTRLIQRRSLQKEFCENPAGYLYRSAVNEATDVFRARQSQRLTGDDIDTLQIPAPKPDPDREYDWKRLREAMNVIQPEFIEILTDHVLYRRLQLSGDRRHGDGEINKRRNEGIVACPQSSQKSDTPSGETT